MWSIVPAVTDPRDGHQGELGGGEPDTNTTGDCEETIDRSKEIATAEGYGETEVEAPRR